MLARLSELIGLNATRARQERLDHIGYKNKLPRCFIDAISFNLMDDPYRFNHCEAQVTDYSTIQQYNQKTGKPSNPFFLQNAADILCLRHTKLDNTIETYITTLENMKKCFTQLECLLKPSDTSSSDDPDINEKIRRLHAIKQIKYELIDLISQFIENATGVIMNDSLTTVEEKKTTRLHKIIDGPELLRELLIHELVYTAKLREPNIDETYQTSMECVDSYQALAFTPFSHDLRLLITKRIATLSDPGIAAELDEIRKNLIAKGVKAASVLHNSYLTFAHCFFRPVPPSPSLQHNSNYAKTPSLSNRVEGVD